MTVSLEYLTPAAWEGWSLLFDFAETITESWTVVGGQMVHVLAAEYGAPELVRATDDVDVLVDVRAWPGGTQRLAHWLEGKGVMQAGASADGIGHRYTRPVRSGPGVLMVDVLAPEGIGARASTRTTGRTRTVQVPGGTQALQRSERIEVTITDASGGGRRTGVCYRVRGPLARVMPKVGLTIGGTVFFRARSGEVPASLLAHEVSHGTQWGVLGDSFLTAYAAGAIFQGLGFGCNPVERAANHGRAHGC